MANADRPSGLSPLEYLNGSPWSGLGRPYVVLAAVTNALFVGDPVALTGSGDSTGLASVDLCAAGSTAVGAIMAIGTNPNGPYINANDLTKVSRPSGAQSVNYYAWVCDDPNVIFEIQEDSDGGALTIASAGLNANWINATPATGVNVSATELDSSSVNTTATLNLKLLGLVRRANNAIGAQAKWRCLINNHAFRTGVAGI
jgi:hypothetical protein